MNRKSCFWHHRIYVLLCFLVVSIFMSSCTSDNVAKVAEKSEVILTYPFSDPDPVPILTRSSLWGKGARLYPYYFIDKFSKEGIEKEWKVVYLENPYIEVSVLPQVGGKIWGAVEKSTGKEFIYTNHVLKFREIALRGPWTSGGIEFNFGIVGHAPSCATPVDYMTSKNPDGSVSCIVGTMDLPSRTRWSVKITVPKDKAYFETQAFWYNPSPFLQSYYSWMNAAVKTGDDLQYIIPGRFHIGHSYSVPLKPWPIDENGRNLSWYKNNDFCSSKSYFTVGEYEDFFGGYWHDSRFGFGHWALYDDVPGHKVWIWSLAGDGAIWENLLTDSDGHYSEPQAGRYFNQSDHGFFSPYLADTWREIWFPYKEIGPMVKASPYGVLNVTLSSNSVSVGIFPLQKINDDLIVSLDGKEIYYEHLVLKPAEIYKKTIPATNGEGILEVNIDNKLNYTSDVLANDLNRPINFYNYDETTIDGLYLLANRFEKERNYYMALQKYLECLERDPMHTRALCRVAELYCRRGEYRKALSYVEKSLKRAIYDPEANYIYGITARQLGDLINAKETLGWATRSLEFRSAAYCQLAEMYFQEKNYELALEYAQRSLDFNKYNMNAYQILATAYRKLNRHEEAKKVLDKILTVDALNHYARFELYLLKPNKKRMNTFQSMIRNEFPKETYIELAIYYVKLGLKDEAMKLLKLATDYPTACYWMAYLLKDELRQKSKELLNKASGLSPLLVFPFREESIPVFKWASEVLPEDWKTRYYLALIFWGKGRVDEAKELLDACSNPDFVPFYLVRAHFYKDSSPEKAQRDFEQALKLDEGNWRSWHHLIDFCIDRKLKSKALKLAEKASNLFPNEVPIQVDLVRAVMENKRFKEAATILDNIVALPYEGASGIHGLFVECQVQLGIDCMKNRQFTQAIKYLEKAKTYPEKLGTGKPYDPDLRMQDYLIAFCYEKIGDRKNAKELQKSIYDYTIRHLSEVHPNLYFGGLVLQQFGNHKLASKLLKQGYPRKDILEVIKKN